MEAPSLILLNASPKSLAPQKMNSEIRKITSMRNDELFEEAKQLQVPYNLVLYVHDNGKLPVVNFAFRIHLSHVAYSLNNIPGTRFALCSYHGSTLIDSS